MRKGSDPAIVPSSLTEREAQRKQDIYGSPVWKQRKASEGSRWLPVYGSGNWMVEGDVEYGGKSMVSFDEVLSTAVWGL